MSGSDAIKDFFKKGNIDNFIKEQQKNVENQVNGVGDFLSTQKRNVDLMLNNKYVIFAIIVAVLFVLAIVYVSLNNVNLSSKYIRVGANAGEDRCSQVKNTLVTARAKLETELNNDKVDAGVQKTVMDAFGRVSIVMSDCAQYNAITLTPVQTAPVVEQPKGPTIAPPKVEGYAPSYNY